MEHDRQETYERIPWETLERPRSDRQWLVIAIAAAVSLGALAFSFMRNQSTAEPSPVAVPPSTVTPATIPSAPPSVTSPMVVAEADLYAIDPERLIDQVAAHAEWFAVEYFSADGSEESMSTLERLLPTGVPLPVVPAGTQVFVDWVGVHSVAEVAPSSYRVEVTVRSMSSHTDGAFVRQPTRVATVDVVLGVDGMPRIAGAPMVSTAAPPPPHSLELIAVPSHVAAQFASHGEIVGGTTLPDGRWQVVVMVTGSDGITRPTLMIGS